MENDFRICVVGLGYVGLPLAVEFGKTDLEVYGFDIDEKKIGELEEGFDSMGEVSDEDLAATTLHYSASPEVIEKANFIIVAVPTPIDKGKKPDLKYVEGASELVAKHLQKGTIVVFESTVYPGVTEEVCIPIIEEHSGLKCGEDWKIGYSPERVNPGDKEHTIDKIVKVVSGMDDESLDVIADVYSKVCRAGVHKAATIKTAEAAKVIENVQRDLNIALVNELSLIFQKMGIETLDVLEAAATKWNFHHYKPGLVGGHCIGVDPYYLTHRAEEMGYHPEVILAGRRINDSMAEHVAEMIVKGLIQAGKSVKDCKVLIMGLTFKENVNDMRNSKAKDVIKTLKNYKIDVYGYDPILNPEDIEKEFEVKPIKDLAEAAPFDGIVLTVLHEPFLSLSVEDLRKHMTPDAVLMDVKAHYLKSHQPDDSLIYLCL